jgi:hypothetical protein
MRRCRTRSSGLPPAIPPTRRRRCLPARRRNSTGWDNLVWTGASRVPLTAMHPRTPILDGVVARARAPETRDQQVNLGSGAQRAVRTSAGSPGAG